MALTILMCVEFLEQGEEAMPKCEHGLTSKECYVCASPKHAEQAEKQEPVAWRTPNWGHGPDEWAYFDADDRPTGANGPTGEALYTTPQPQQEPVKMVAYNCLCGRIMKFESVNGIVAPQREWVGLTLEEIDLLEELYAPPVHPDFVNDASHCLELIRHVEAKLKEKNCG
jgi:hypothetical protein